MKIIILITTFIFSFNFAFAQQDALMRLYPMESVWFNPATAGINGGKSILIAGRSQYMNTNHNPTTFIGSYDQNLDNINSALGITMMYDEVGIEQNIAVGLLYNYKIQLSDSIAFRFGTKVSYLRKEFSNEKFPMLNQDQVFPDKPAYVWDLDAGFNLSISQFQFGFSVKHLTEPSFSLTDPKSYFYDLIRHYYIITSYNWEVAKSLTLQPAIRYQATLGTNLLDLMLNSRLFQHYIIGFSYDDGLNTQLLNSNNPFSILLGYQFKKGNQIMVAYDPAQDERLGSSLEVAVGLNF